MSDHSLQRLEFDKILEIVQSYAGSQPGRKLISRLLPADCREEAQLLRDETLHASKLISLEIEPPVSNLEGIIQAVAALRQGAIALDPFHLRSAGEALVDMAIFSKKFQNSADSEQGFLNPRIAKIPVLDSLSRMLLRITTADGELASDASPELKRLSKRIQSLRSSLAAKLSAVSSRLAGIGVLRDAPPSIRSGRYVLPVTAGKRGSVKGLILDRSDSGATLFIEPAELVEGGNELQEVLLDMQQERRRILREATVLLRVDKKEIETGIAVLTELDFVFARARYHLKEKTAFPEEGNMDLRELSHPLLSSDTVVKSRVKLHENWRVLVISGPNAGGKSVLLKAVSLASICNRSGIGAHTSVSSTMPFFNKVMVSMGDNQSISMHLSTYSARLSEQKDILLHGDSETLAIIDEPAAGTDPVTGAALATVFLGELADRGVSTIVSTHMGQLKLLAREKQGFFNGSMSFNPETLTPGYEFIPDIPGASCTLEAAAIAGFPSEMLSKASDLAGDSFSLDALVISLRDLEEARQKELFRLSEDRKHARKSRKYLEKQLKETKADLEKRIENVTEEKIRTLNDIQSRADSLLVSIANSSSSSKRREIRKEVTKLAAREKPQSYSNTSSNKTIPVIKHGDYVKIDGWSVAGTVEKVGRANVMVRIGSILVKKKIDQLQILPKPDIPKKATSEYNAIEESPEANLLGLTIDEAIAELDIKLDNCVAINFKRIRVIHGKGRLMQGVTEWLRHDKRLKSVSIAPPEEGGVGASIIILKG